MTPKTIIAKALGWTDTTSSKTAEIINLKAEIILNALEKEGYSIIQQPEVDSFEFPSKIKYTQNCRVIPLAYVDKGIAWYGSLEYGHDPFTKIGLKSAIEKGFVTLDF